MDAPQSQSGEPKACFHWVALELGLESRQDSQEGQRGAPGESRDLSTHGRRRPGDSSPAHGGPRPVPGSRARPTPAELRRGAKSQGAPARMAAAAPQRRGGRSTCCTSALESMPSPRAGSRDHQVKAGTVPCATPDQAGSVPTGPPQVCGGLSPTGRERGPQRGAVTYGPGQSPEGPLPSACTAAARFTRWSASSMASAGPSGSSRDSPMTRMRISVSSRMGTSEQRRRKKL